MLPLIPFMLARMSLAEFATLSVVLALCLLLFETALFVTGLSLCAAVERDCFFAGSSSLPSSFFRFFEIPVDGTVWLGEPFAADTRASSNAVPRSSLRCLQVLHSGEMPF